MAASSARRPAGEDLVAGLDEAGRGPVFGPLVLCAFAMRRDRLGELQALGVRDSKQLSGTARERMYEPLRALATGLAVYELAPAEIDAAPGGLDVLEAAHGAALIAAVSPRIAYVDAIGKGGALHRARLEERLAGRDIELVVENKADDTYQIVGAASIVAKVIRDRRLAELDREHGPLGSGYPSDPATRAAVRRIVEAHLATGTPLPGFVRARWSTVARLLEPAEARKVQGELSF